MVPSHDPHVVPDFHDNELNLVGNQLTWVVNSDASFHLTPDQGCFSSYIVGDYGYVKMGNEGAYLIIHIGDVYLLTSIRCRMVLSDVRYVPYARLNLILVGQLDDEGYNGSFRNIT